MRFAPQTIPAAGAALTLKTAFHTDLQFRHFGSLLAI
jgi:hypothetical protein